MSKYLYISFLIFSISASVYGQRKTMMNCGTLTTDEDIARLKLNKFRAKYSQNRNSEITYIPVQFHLVASSNGGGRIAPSQVFDGLCKLNEDFAPLDLQFYFNGNFNFIDNNAMYEMEFPPIPQGVRTLFSLNRVPGNVNIFIGNGLSSGNSGFYTGSSDVIYMDKRYVNSNDIILAHELGHFLSLPHTFLGWESTEYNPDEATPTQVFRGEVAYDVEYVDREKNCEESGDFFCGTPADYITNWNGGCDYTGGAVDPDSVLIDPDETNVMSYYSFSGCEQFTFSEDQSAAMLADFEARFEFNGTNIGKQEAVVNDVILNSPSDGEELAVNEINLSWDPVENATLYIVEVSRIPTFFALDAQILIREQSVTIEDLSVDKKYYWRVIAFNETNFCDRMKSQVNSFKTTENSSSVEPVFQKEGLTLFPNPTELGSSLTISSEEPLGKCKITVYDASGQLVHEFKKEIKEGDTQIKELRIIEQGLYLISIKGREDERNLKLLVQ